MLSALDRPTGSQTQLGIKFNRQSTTKLTRLEKTYQILHTISYNQSSVMCQNALRHEKSK